MLLQKRTSKGKNIFLNRLIDCYAYTRAGTYVQILVHVGYTVLHVHIRVSDDVYVNFFGNSRRS